jgi:O-antigen ligase/polysaccharide polymerase Wzy-like membrane protein
MHAEIAMDRPLEVPSAAMDVLFAGSIAALFSGFHQSVIPVKVQLFDVFAIVTIFFAALKGFASPRPAPVVLAVLILYLIYYSISALFVGMGMGAKEIVQIFLLMGFLFVAFGYYRTRPTDRLLIVSAVLIIALLVYNIAWHVAHGEYVGWKQLNEPKTIFTVLPLLLILLSAHFGGPGRRFVFVLAACAAAVIILLSGERKAYIFAVIALAIWAGPWKMLRYALPLALLGILLTYFADADKTGYLDRQLNTFHGLTSDQPKREPTLSELIDDNRSMTISTAQREFSRRIAQSMWEKQPMLGIGTGTFGQAILEYKSVPVVFRMNIHGEFYRALYENGIVGLALYIACWVTALGAILLHWPRVDKIKLLTVIMLVIYCSFEASKELTQLCICALPFICAGRESA